MLTKPPLHIELQLPFQKSNKCALVLTFQSILWLEYAFEIYGERFVIAGDDTLTPLFPSQDWAIHEKRRG